MILNRSGFKWVAMLLVAALAVAGASPAHAKSPVVTGVQVKGASGKIVVQVAATGQVDYRVLNLTDPQDMTVVEIFPAQLSTDVQKSVDVSAGVVERVRVGQFSDNPDVVRLVIDLKAPTQAQIVRAPGSRGLTVCVATNGSSAKASTAGGSAQATSPSRGSVPVTTTSPAITYSASPVRGGRVAQGSEPDITPTHSYSNRSIARGNDEIAQGGRRRRPTHYYGGHYVSLDFVNADLIYVLKILSKEMGLNVVTTQSVKGTVTMTLKDVPAIFAWKLVLNISGFSSMQVRNVLIVGTADELGKINPQEFLSGISNRENEVVLPIPLEHAKPSSVADSINSAYAGRNVRATAQDTFVVVTAPNRQIILDIKDFVQKIDVPPPAAVIPKTEVIPIKFGAVQTMVQLAKAQVPGLNYSVEDRLNALIVRGNDADIENLKAFLAQIDIPLQQVMLDIRVVSLDETATKTLGFSIGSSTGNFGVFAGTGGTPVIFTETFPSAAGTTTAASTTGQLAISPFTRTPFVIGATLSMLIARNDAKVISTPRIMTQSSHEASVLIGDKFPIVYFDPRAGQFQVQYVDIGVKLTVKPIVSADSTVTVELAPEVSTLLGLINNQYPETGVTTVKTLVHVHDGDTIIVGGLLREIEQYTLQKLPFLGDLPVLGEFFRNTSITKEKDEVFITLTPKIMP